jgi:hypothetical protein
MQPPQFQPFASSALRQAISLPPIPQPLPQPSHPMPYQAPVQQPPQSYQHHPQVGAPVDYSACLLERFNDAHQSHRNCHMLYSTP